MTRKNADLTWWQVEVVNKGRTFKRLVTKLDNQKTRRPREGDVSPFAVSNAALDLHSAAVHAVLRARQAGLAR